MARSCKIGKSCGSTCINRGKECVKELYIPGIVSGLKAVANKLSIKSYRISEILDELGEDAPEGSVTASDSSTSDSEASSSSGAFYARLAKDDIDQTVPHPYFGEVDWDEVKSKIDSRSFLGRGAYGKVFAIDDDRVAKVGQISEEEALLTKEIGDLGVGPKVYGYRIGKSWNSELGVMVLERMKGKPISKLDPDKDYDSPGMDEARESYWAARAKLHRAGIAHQDMHDDNVMMNGKRVRIIDFGLAKKSYGLALVEASQVFGSKFFAFKEAADMAMRMSSETYLRPWSGSQGLNDRDSGYIPPTGNLEKMSRNWYSMKNYLGQETGDAVATEKFLARKKISSTDLLDFYLPTSVQGRVEEISKKALEILYDGVE
jgi:tRNA A-37 threonylcarbamoyl transferase component Bud32